MTVSPSPPPPHLRLDIAFPPAALLAHAVADGHVGLPVYLENHSSYPAQFPFFCVMDLGLNLQPEANWTLSRIASDGRKLVRCSFANGATLLPGDRLRAMTLVVSVLAGQGLRIAFNGATPVPLDSLRDLKLFTVTGAANFPAQRGSVTVAADQLRRALLLALANAAGTERLTG
jgi:hypothetical protein